MSSFSKKHGYSSAEKPITIREAAPRTLREFILQAAYSAGLSSDSARDIVCRVLRKAPDRDNWSERPVRNETQELLDGCDWYKVYDIIEALAERVHRPEDFADEVNDYFKAEGIGWQLEGSEILYRGPENFEQELHKAEGVLDNAGLKTAANELREAINDLSRRPEADITGAVQHALTGLECTAREASGGSKDTLGALIKKRPDLVPPQLGTAISKIYGFGSDQGRHLEEGREPSFEEAELLVGLSAALSTYIGRKFKSPASSSPSTADDTDLPF